jgi:hypothetical protein
VGVFEFVVPVGGVPVGGVPVGGVPGVVGFVGDPAPGVPLKLEGDPSPPLEDAIPPPKMLDFA